MLMLESEFELFTYLNFVHTCAKRAGTVVDRTIDLEADEEFPEFNDDVFLNDPYLSSLIRDRTLNMVPNKLESIDKPVALHYQELIEQSNAKFPKILTEKQVLLKYQEMKEQMKYLDEEEKRFKAYEKLLNCPRQIKNWDVYDKPPPRPESDSSPSTPIQTSPGKVKSYRGGRRSGRASRNLQVSSSQNLKAKAFFDA
ncbi:DgyrCDS9141 [Dimorphilus gyrociliatus]|uniref:DgyrCDS9141 n=1 Tax=Dimorphilus gyrociliatus TaxID=2664684 RepID=A0A7I8W1E7_9ANNE|nr:DgyrCDS9141 [Dimorphilus gyrociliatus]